MKLLNCKHYVFTANQCKILTNILYPKDICIDARLSFSLKYEFDL